MAVRGGVKLVDRLVQLVGKVFLPLPAAHQGVHAGQHRFHSASDSFAGHVAPGGGVVRERGQVVAQVSDELLAEELAGLLAAQFRHERDGKHGGLGQAGVVHHAAQVVRHRLRGLFVEAVEHDYDLDAAAGGVVEEVPHQLIRVARRGGNENPQVRRGEELGRQCPVLVVDGVEIGGVEKRQALRDARRVHDAQCGGALVSCAVGAGEARQDLRGVEPVCVARVGHQHRLAGSRADHARVGHSLAQKRVDEGGLAGTGGAADDGKQGSVQVGQARQHIVVELIDYGAGFGSDVDRQ